jgi:hypothetical protein
LVRQSILGRHLESKITLGNSIVSERRQTRSGTSLSFCSHHICQMVRPAGEVSKSLLTPTFNFVINHSAFHCLSWRWHFIGWSVVFEYNLTFSHPSTSSQQNLWGKTKCLGDSEIYLTDWQAFHNVKVSPFRSHF